MAEKISVGKKKKIIAGAIAGAVVLTGAGVGLGVGLAGGGEQLPDHLIVFEVEQGGVESVYTTSGQKVAVEDLVPGQKIAFPLPDKTTITEGGKQKYFVGWATRREATVPNYFIGEEIITVSNKTQTFHAVYREASEACLIFDDNAGANDYYTVAYNGVSTEADGMIVIPNVYRGKPVTAITKRSGNPEVALLQRVIIAEGIQEIGEEAFYGCKNLKSVTFSSSNITLDAGSATLSVKRSLLGEEDVEGLTTIGTKAFINCASLQAITIPAGVSNIATETFKGCSSLATVTFESKDILERIGYSAFDGTAVKEMDFSEFTKLKVIAAKAFQSCESLEVFKMPNTVTNLGEMAFCGAVKLAEVNLSTAIVGSVGDGDGAVVDNGQLVRVFENCDSLKSIHIPAGVTKLATKLFNGCDKLAEVTFENADAITEIHNYAFQNCKAIVSLPEFKNVVSYGVAVFQGCESLESYILPSTLKGAATENQFWNPQNNVLPARMFTGCTNLSSIIIPEGVQTIGEFAFAFSGVKDVVIPASVKAVQYRAFHAMPRLQSITFNCNALTSDGGDTYQPYYKAEKFIDANENGKYDVGEEFEDLDGNGECTTQSPIDSMLKKITFGENVGQIKFASVGVWSNAVAGHNFLETIEFKSANPPTITNLPVFSSVTKVIVPAGSLDAYKAAFADYADLMVEAEA